MHNTAVPESNTGFTMERFDPVFYCFKRHASCVLSWGIASRVGLNLPLAPLAGEPLRAPQYNVKR